MSSPKSVSAKIPTRGLGFRRDGIETNLGGLPYSYSEASLPLSGDESNGRRQSVVQRRKPTSRKIIPETSSSLILQSILQHLCTLYEKDATRRQRLFISICSSLTKMKLMTPNFQFDELAALRSHYQHAFAKLIKVARGGLDSNGHQPLSSSNLQLPGLTAPILCDESYLFHNSRYSTEFEELSFLAKGGFGSVFKVRNRLDDAHYAIKKIVLKHRHPEYFFKILREVTTLAQLTHPNIVCYKTAWLEPYLSSSDTGPKKSGGSVDAFSDSETSSFDSYDDENPIDRDENLIFKEDESSEDNNNGPEDDDTSWGVVFEADDIDIDETDAKKRRGAKKSVISCQILEVDELDTDEEELPCVVGMAATPPQASFKFQQKKKTSSLRASTFDSDVRKTSRLVVEDNGFSKFWIGSSSDSEESMNAKKSKKKKSRKESSRVHFSKKVVTSFNCDVTSVQCGVASGNCSVTSENCSGATGDRDTTNPKRKITSVVPIENSAYWSHRLLDEQDRRLKLLFNATDNIRPPVSSQIPNPDKAVLYIQMQLCERTLRTWIDDRNERIQQNLATVSFEENFSIFRQILSGVNYIHSKGIVHRDLKPRNIFIDCERRVQIGDFGLAKQELFNDSSSEPNSPTTNCTNGDVTHPTLERRQSQHTSGVGTQAYAAPEQLTHGLINFKSDMYSLGIILFELFNCFTTNMERSCAISGLRTAAASGDPCLIPKDLSTKFPAIGETVKALTLPDPSRRPSASELLATTFASQRENAQKSETSDLARLKDENGVLREKVKFQETQMRIQMELIQKQQERIKMLEKMINANLYVSS